MYTTRGSSCVWHVHGMYTGAPQEILASQVGNQCRPEPRTQCTAPGAVRAQCATQAAAWCARVCAALQVFISQGGKSTNPYPWSNATSGVFPPAATHKASARPPTKVVDAGFGGGGAIGDFTFDATVTGL